MANVRDIANYLNKICPQSLCFDGDNVGLIVGSYDTNVSKTLITLDVDEKVAHEAADIGAELIVSHHPLMFHPIKKLTENDAEQRTLRVLLKNGISLFSAHTNLDSLNGGLNDYLAKVLEIRDTSIIDVTKSFDGVNHGFGRVGYVGEGVTLSDMIKRCINKLKIGGVRYIGDENRIVKKVALNCGSGSDEIQECISMGVDLFITGDVKYNPGRDCYDNNMALIDAGHYETEHIVMDLLYDILQPEFNEIQFSKSKANVPVFKFSVL